MLRPTSFRQVQVGTECGMIVYVALGAQDMQLPYAARGSHMSYWQALS